jgi:hypothetical protein
VNRVSKYRLDRGVFLMLAAVAAPLAAQSAEQVTADIKYLASDELEGRGVGTAGLEKAASYIAERFADIGLVPAGTNGYFQDFRLDPSAPALAHAGVDATDVRNVVGMLEGAGPLAREVVILGAHYDHLGLGGSGSLDPDSMGVVHNGADDNASGTAALMAVASTLASRTVDNRRTFYFVAFTAEEFGLLGSDYYAKNPTYDPGIAYAMINFDMVGRLRDEGLMVIGVGSAQELPTLVARANEKHGLTLQTTPDPWGASDHTSFYAQEMPVVHLFTNTHPEYHRTTDDWPLINADGIVQVASFAADLAWELATHEQRLTFLSVEAPAPASGGGYGAWLGSIPDMSGSPGGVRFTGVREGSPAESAGMQSGDILVQLGEHVIENLYDMTDALRAYEPGDTVDYVVMRDGERIEGRVTLGRRGG